MANFDFEGMRIEGGDMPETPEEKAFREAEAKLTPEEREARAKKAQAESDKHMRELVDSGEKNALEKAIAALKRPPDGPGLRDRI